MMMTMVIVMMVMVVVAVARVMLVILVMMMMMVMRVMAMVVIIVLATTVLAYVRFFFLGHNSTIAFQEHGEINVSTVVQGLTLPEKVYMRKSSKKFKSGLFMKSQGGDREVLLFFYSHTNFGVSMRMMRCISVISDRL